MLRATTACNFSSLIWPHGSAPAALASLLFDPPEPQIIGIIGPDRHKSDGGVMVGEFVCVYVLYVHVQVSE